MESITSRSNPLCAHLRKLAASASHRRESGEFLCDSPKLLEEVLLWRRELLKTVLCTDPGKLPELPERTRVVVVPESLMEYLSPARTPQGVISLCRKPEEALPETLPGRRYALLDGVQDPGNVGTILRTADALFCDGLLLVGGCADPWQPKAVRASMGAVLLTEGITREEAAALEDKDLRRAEEILEVCERQDYRILTIADAAYPRRLRNIFDPPILLYCRGRLPLMDEEAAIAVVGTRSYTPYGALCAGKLGGQLAAGGAVIVTGLAYGIDSLAARAALRNGGRVLGVLGCGLDVVYPRGSEELYEDVAAAGALITEYAPGTLPLSGNFPVRNRILSGLSVAVLVVEAPERSGALITAGTALEQGREVFAVPGPIDAPGSVGCNRLLRDGAGLVSDGWDLLREYEERFPGKLRREAARREVPETPGYERREQQREAQRRETRKLPPRLDPQGAELTDDQIALLRTLTEEPMLVDDLVEASGIPVRRVLSALTMLEIDGYVSQAPGKRYARTVTLSE